LSSALEVLRLRFHTLP